MFAQCWTPISPRKVLSCLTWSENWGFVIAAVETVSFGLSRGRSLGKVWRKHIILLPFRMSASNSRPKMVPRTTDTVIHVKLLRFLPPLLVGAIDTLGSVWWHLGPKRLSKAEYLICIYLFIINILKRREINFHSQASRRSKSQWNGAYRILCRVRKTIQPIRSRLSCFSRVDCIKAFLV